MTIENIIILPILIISIVFHEVSHGWVAYKLGDPTAKNKGRLTLNPLAHLDLVGSFIVPLILVLSQSPFFFAWAKPVPVNFEMLKDKKADTGLVAFSGPFSNFLLAFCILLLIRLFGINPQSYTGSILSAFILVNLSLCAFNLFPLLPLDGGRILASVLPTKLSLLYLETQKYGFLILITLLFLLPILGIDVFSFYMRWMYQGLVSVLSFIL